MNPRPLIALACLALLTSAGLPATGPVPEEKPATADTAKPAETKKDDQPEAADDKKPDTAVSEQEGSAPAEVVTPQAKPAQEDQPSATEKPADTPKDTDTAKPETKPVVEEKPKLTIKPEDPKEYASCLVDLKAMGAVFKEENRIDDGNGCGIDKPLTVETVLPGIDLKPEGKMRCETALELAKWTRDAVLPAAKAAMEKDGPVTAINQASSYVCRLRNNASTGKISEHARGNAIDIASFTFKSGETLAIQPRDEDSTLAGAFQRAVTATGCLYFETVLDPGSDEAHENHLHFDVIERKGGYRYCR